MEYTPMAIWGRELRYYRQRAGLTQVELAQKIKYSPSLVSQIETGQTPATIEFAEACDEALDTAGALTRLLDYRKGSQFPPWLGEWLPYEQNSTILRTFQPRAVHALLQTTAYARIVLDGDQEEVKSRLERQQILERPDAPTLHVILDESVLWHDIGGPEVMYEQLMHLVEMSSRKVKIQILPNGAYPSTQAPLVFATLKNGGSAAYLETAIHGVVITSPQDIERADALWESIKAEALPVGMSRELIRRTAEERWKP
jgi:transcriptional regulator with XRE-family HTH domain